MMKSKGKECLNKFLEFVSNLSLGRYKSSFFFKGKKTEESLLGGLLAIIVYILIFAYAIGTLVQVI